MIQSLYSAAVGLHAQQGNIDTIANNIANVNTVAFQSGRADFKDTLYYALQGSGTGSRMTGSGSTIGAIQRLTDAGPAVSTGNSLDMMLDGDGYFAVTDGNGNASFTRDGSFKVSERNGVGYLVTADGQYVLGTDGQPIEVNGDPAKLAVAADGRLTLNGAPIGQLQVVSFPNPEGLSDVGHNCFAYTPAAGAVSASAATVKQGWLEGSNVDLAEEMTRLMRAQKAYALLGRAVTEADQMESVANNMIR